METIAWNGADGKVRITVCLDSIEVVTARLLADGQMPLGTHIVRNPVLPSGKPRALRLINDRLIDDASAPPDRISFAERVDAARTIDDLKALLRTLK